VSKRKRRTWDTLTDAELERLAATLLGWACGIVRLLQARREARRGLPSEEGRG